MLAPLPPLCLAWELSGVWVPVASTAGLITTTALVALAGTMLGLTRTLPYRWRPWRWLLLAAALLVTLVCATVGTVRLADDWLPTIVECGITLLYSEGGNRCG